MFLIRLFCKKEGVIFMREKLMDFGGIILFYFVIILGVLLLNLRFAEANTINAKNKSETYIAMNN